MKIKILDSTNTHTFRAVVSGWCWQTADVSQIAKEIVRVFRVEGAAVDEPSFFGLRVKVRVCGTARS